MTEKQFDRLELLLRFQCLQNHYAYVMLGTIAIQGLHGVPDEQMKLLTGLMHDQLQSSIERHLDVARVLSELRDTELTEKESKLQDLIAGMEADLKKPPLGFKPK